MEATIATMNSAPQKEYNINRLTLFTGDRTKIENFIQECNVYLYINDMIYNTDPVRGHLLRPPSLTEYLWATTPETFCLHNPLYIPPHHH